MWSAAPNASPLVPGRGMPIATTQMLQSQQLRAQLLQRHMTQIAHPQQLHLQLPQLSQRRMTQPRISQPQGCRSHWSQTQMLQSHAQMLQCQPQMLQSQTQTPQTYAQMLQSQTQKPEAYTEMLQSQTCAPQADAQMLQSHMHDAEQTYESCRAVPNTTPIGGQGMPSQQLQQLLALMSDLGQSKSEIMPHASASQGPWVADQCVPGFLHTSSYTPQLVTTYPHMDAAGQLQSQAFAQPPPVILDQHEPTCWSAHPLQRSKAVDSCSLQELFVTADQQLLMLCQLSAPIQSADDLLFRLNSMASGSISSEEVAESKDDLLFRLNSMDSDSINAEQVAESKDVGRGSSACQGHVDSHSAPTEAQMVELLQSSAQDVAELLQRLSAPGSACHKQNLARAASLLMAQPAQPCLP